MSRVIAAFAQFFDGTGQPLENGWLKFTESQSDTLKPTYADANQSIANENPLQLDAEGRCPNCFGQGIYRVVLFENNPVTNVPGAMIQTFDPVTAEYVNTGNGSGNFGDWDIDETYQIGQVVLYGGVYYRSLTANNIGNQPDLNSDQWEVIEFLRYWNADVTYADGDPVFWDSELYFSLSDGNMGNQPDTSPTYWKSTIATAVDFAWSAVEVYDTGYIVYYDGIYYRSITDSNVGNQPDTNLDKWEIIDFLRTWNDSVTYAADDLILYSGKLYTSLLGSNINNQPDISPTYWQLYTPYVYWYESGTDWTHTGAAYNIGDATHRVAVIHLDAFDAFPTTPSSAPTADYEVANKKYVDDSILQDWEETGTALQPVVSDDQDLGSATNLVSNVFIANDPTADEQAVRLSYFNNNNKSKNYLDNGDFQVAQRGTSQSTTGLESLDRWIYYHSTTTATYSQEAFTIGQTDVPNNPEFYSKAVVSTGGTASSISEQYQAIMDVKRLAGETKTLLFWAKADSSINMATSFTQHFGTGGSPSSNVTGIGATTYALTTAWQKFSVQITFPSIAGKTLGTDLNSRTNCIIWFDAGSDYDSQSNSLGNQSGTFYIADMQLEDGDFATVFERLDYNAQLWRCLPHYEQSYYSGIARGTATFLNSVGFHARSGSSQYNNVRFLREKVLTPAITLYSPSTGSSGYVYNVDTTSDISANASTVGHAGFLALGLGAAPSAGDRLAYHWTAETGF